MHLLIMELHFDAMLYSWVTKILLWDVSNIYESCVPQVTHLSFTLCIRQKS